MTDKNNSPEDYSANELANKLNGYILSESDRTEIMSCMNANKKHPADH